MGAVKQPLEDGRDTPDSIQGHSQTEKITPKVFIVAMVRE